jgi:hypothetical protein
MICTYLHPTACCFLCLLHPVLQRIFICGSQIILLVVAFAASKWTDWCLFSHSVPRSDVYDMAPANCLDLDPLSPGWGGYLCMFCWCGIVEEDDNEKKWEVLRTIL